MTNKKIAFVGGTGPEGIGLALRMATVGHEIMIGSRTDERGKEVAARILSDAVSYTHLTLPTKRIV